MRHVGILAGDLVHAIMKDGSLYREPDTMQITQPVKIRPKDETSRKSDRMLMQQNVNANGYC